ncbi:MAG: hypothetical protein ACK4PR_09855, partial [Gammaproteobacteria bacterium]
MFKKVFKKKSSTSTRISNTDLIERQRREAETARWQAIQETERQRKIEEEKQKAECKRKEEEEYIAQKKALVKAEEKRVADLNNAVTNWIEQFRQGETTELIASNFPQQLLPPTYEYLKWSPSNGIVKIAVALSDDHIACAIGKTIEIRSLKTGNCELVLTEHSDDITALIVLPSGHLVSGSQDTTIKIWDMEAASCVRTLQGHKEAVLALVIFADGLISGSADKTIKLWNIETGANEKTWIGQNGKICALSILPPNRLASAAENSVWIWDLDKGKCESTLTHKEVKTLIILPDGRLASAGYCDGLKIWDLRAKTYEQLDTTKNDNRYHSTPNFVNLVVLPDGLVVGIKNGKIYLWNPEIKVPERKLAKNNFANIFTILPNNQLIGFTEFDIKIWHVSPLLGLHYINLAPVFDALLSYAEQPEGIYLKTLDLSGVIISAEGYEKLLSLLQKNIEIETLILDDCYSLSELQKQSLQQALTLVKTKHKVIAHLDTWITQFQQNDISELSIKRLPAIMLQASYQCLRSWT